ncbi:MAG: hypothetical protein C4529_09010 [Deltaproteobacteria bacterium]|nr:MAG: hypothetical protein C4529_09010 [Deltaproteobacteria bacterium]
MIKGKVLALCLAAALLAIGASTGAAREVEFSSQAKKCLKCHAKEGIRAAYPDGETVSARVSPPAFRTSVHGILDCTGCHPACRAVDPSRRPVPSRSRLREQASSACRSCHSAGQLRAKPIHENLLAREGEGGVPVCSDCHEAHTMTAVSGGKVYSGEKQYCMSCHRYDMEMMCRNKEKIPLKVSLSDLESFAHDKLRCSDCHYGFSQEEHPKRNFRSRRDYTVASSESCRRCHFDKYTKTLDSVHYAILSQGNLHAPVCNDCHGSHAIARVSHGIKGRVLTTQKCRKCHDGVYEIYAKSVHGKALLSEHNQDVPICIDCHTAHDIQNPLTLEYHERIPQMCGNCHANPAIVSKYGLSTDVLKTYLADFHGVTLGFYKKQREKLYKPARPIAVCTDCHGTHSIAGTESSNPPTVKANLVKRCQKCHHDANEKFPNAWLFHYKPSPTRFPLVFMVNTAYWVFLPVMVVGLVLQILLHIWRYAVNR